MELGQHEIDFYPKNKSSRTLLWLGFRLITSKIFNFFIQILKYMTNCWVNSTQLPKCGHTNKLWLSFFLFGRQHEKSQYLKMIFVWHFWILWATFIKGVFRLLPFLKRLVLSALSNSIIASILKVSWFRNVFLVSSVLPKTN